MTPNFNNLTLLFLLAVAFLTTACGTDEALLAAEKMACDDISWNDPQAESEDPGLEDDEELHSDCLRVKQEVIGVLESLKPGFTKCYQSIIDEGASPEGKIELGFVIPPSGDVQCVDILKNETRNLELGACVAAVVYDAQFRTITCEDAPPVEVTYPIVFVLQD